MIKKFLVAFLVLFLVLAVIGLFLPKDYRVERRQFIAADATTILALTSDLPTWESWSAWNKQADPDCKWEFPDATTMFWDGPINLEGKMWVTSATAEGMTWDLAFEDGAYLAKGGLTFVPAENGTEVIWYTEGDIDAAAPLAGWFSVMMDSMIGPSFEVNLTSIEAELAKGK
ncbi:MAG: SRPBCC family protein [Planctomycetota bacterium]|nr:SRPBCC family protein [Planctomycetota bacterium]MDA1114113.1 SRPBCC family protein [Planctomycetota bacterium]